MFLTKRQKEVLDFLKEYLSRHGYAPTFDEIAVYFGFSSKGTVYKHVKALKQKGLIKHEWNRTRAIELQQEVTQLLTLPVLGLVAAGKPIEAIEAAEEVGVPATFLRQGEHFVLRVVGDSMVDEHITAGDFVVVQRKSDAENGETVVALIDNSEVTIKKIFRHNGQIELRAANEELESLFLNPERVQVQGVVVGVLRKY